ncbi:MAG: B12-binding domain-containing radical SAM protein [Deltaproteobacteria bacterium]|nr:B12-binding domain-containing radical SAM protein [Deltaproteobacteria bacterium]
MRLGFISPSFRVLEMNWDTDYEMIKLGVPTFMGFLSRAGHTDVRHWDFDAQICEAMEADPRSFDLRQYLDTAAVADFLAGTGEGMRAQTEKILDALSLVERDIFGISLSAVIDRIVNIRAIAALGQCMAKVLKERYPRCSVVLGGLQASPTDLHEEIYRELMASCPVIDCCYIGEAREAGVQLFRNIHKGEWERNARLAEVLYRATDAAGAPVVRRGAAPNEYDDDIQASRPATKVVNNAIVAQFEPRAAGEVISASSLMRRRPEEPAATPAATPAAPDTAGAHPYDEDDDGDARLIGPQEYDSVPANVPIFDPQLVDHFRYSGLQIMKRFRFDKELMLRFSRFENDRIVVLPHIFVRGCNAPCGFCAYAYTKIHGEEVAQTVAGLKYLSETYNCKAFHFLNTQINSVYSYCDEFCDQVIAAKLDILWSDCANMRALDEKLLEKLRRAGAMRLVFGVEAPEDSMLKYIHKGVKSEKVARLLKASHDLGIWNHMLLIAGMPHETKAKQDRMMEFLTATAPTCDFYSVSSYYLIQNSPWGRDPAKFGIERISDPSDLLESQGFNEIADGRWESDGLKWPEKKQQIVDSTKRFYSTLAKAKGQSRSLGGNIDLYMLMFLYATLGHDKKAEIVDIYNRTALAAGEVSSGVEQAKVAEDEFHVHVPVIVGRVNEGDQSQLSYVALEFVVSPRAERATGFCASERFTYAYRSPRFAEDGQLSADALGTFRDDWPATLRRVTAMVAPFLRALDARFAPASPGQMAELVARHLPRQKAFANEGYVVVGPKSARGRTIMERYLQYSGVA